MYPHCIGIENPCFIGTAKLLDEAVWQGRRRFVQFHSPSKEYGKSRPELPCGLDFQVYFPLAGYTGQFYRDKAPNAEVTLAIEATDWNGA